MAARGYQNYHGKKNGRRTALVVVLALVVALCAVYLVLQNYIVYNSDGSVSLDLPFLRGEEEPSSGPQDGEEPPLEILRPQRDAAGPDTLDTAFTVAEGDLYSLWADEASGPAAGVQGLVVEVKGETGVFYYQSEWAAQGAADSRAVSRAGVAAARAGARDWSAVAAIHCLRDDFYPMADMEGAGICQSTGYIWFGVDNAHYLEPSKPGARAYLCGVAAECRDMGFDEVLLRSFAYPTQGNLQKIDYSGMELSKEEALEALLRELRETLGEDVLLSVELPAETVRAGHDSAGGVELSRIAPLADRIYVTGAAEEERPALEEALKTALGGEISPGRLVLETRADA